MDSIRSYLLTVTGGALVCAMANKLPIKGTLSAVIRMICGIFMALTVLSPLTSVKLDQLESVTTIVWSAAEDTTATGENLAREAMAKIIIEQTEAYIMDKAADLGVSLDVSVSVSSDALPVPERVYLTGAVSPYARSVLTGYITDHLGIEGKEQIWTQP